MKKYGLIFLVISFLSGCKFLKNDKKENQSKPLSHLIRLTESTHIIRMLIVKNKIGNLLQDHDPEQLNLLLDNVSPAKMAFESEVLATTVPLVVVYYFKENTESSAFIKILENLSNKYDNRIKFVVVDTEKLFSLVQDSNIEKIPTILLVRNREIIDHVENNINTDEFEKMLVNIIQKLN